MLPPFLIKKENEKNKKDWKPEFLYQEVYVPNYRKESENKDKNEDNCIIIQIF